MHKIYFKTEKILTNWNIFLMNFFFQSPLMSVRVMGAATHIESPHIMVRHHLHHFAGVKFLLNFLSSVEVKKALTVNPHDF